LRLAQKQLRKCESLALILDFPDAIAHQAFLDRAGQERRDAFAEFESLPLYNQAIVYPRSKEDENWVRSAIESVGEAFEDVQFS
jgi:hypothetical protein